MASELFNKNVAYFKDLSPSILEAAAPYLRSYAPDELPREHPKHKCIQFRGLAPQRDTVDAQTFAFLSNVLLRADAQKIAFLDQPATANAYFLVLVGIPTKAEIAQIIKEFDPAHLMIVEPDHRCFAKSLSEIDWPSHINDLRALGCLTHFILDTQLDIVIENIWRLCRRVNPARADNMACLVFDHHEFGEHLLGALSRDVNMISTNLGFFHDEIMMLWNAYANLSAPNTRLYDRGGERRLKATAFVVGSGPSLDNDIAFIRAHADRVIIISAGSALDPLLQNKITPDFHIENENVRVVDRFVEINKTFDLKQLKLVASTTVERSATNMFHEAVVYNRQALSTYPMFGGKPENTMYLPDPTVGNAALCFALEAGFEEIVLFGLDMGSATQAITIPNSLFITPVLALSTTLPMILRSRPTSVATPGRRNDCYPHARIWATPSSSFPASAGLSIAPMVPSYKAQAHAGAIRLRSPILPMTNAMRCNL